MSVEQNCGPNKISVGGFQSVADARSNAEHCPCVPHDQQAAEAADRALERSVVLVEQLRTLRFALLNGWNGPVGLG